MGFQSFAKAGADATNSAITTFASGMAERNAMRAAQKENERLNKLTWQAMGNRINTVNLQRGLLRQQTGTDLYNIGKEANRAASASVNNAAAAGIEGASVNDAVRDIARQNQEAQATTRQNELVQEVNLDTQIDDIIQSAKNAQRYSQKPTSVGEIVGRAWGTSTMQFFSSLAGSSFDYMPTSGSQGSGGTQSASSVNGTYNAEEATRPSGSGYRYGFDVGDTGASRYISYNDSTFNTGQSTYDSSSTGTTGGYNFTDYTSLFNGGS